MPKVQTRMIEKMNFQNPNKLILSLIPRKMCNFILCDPCELGGKYEKQIQFARRWREMLNSKSEIRNFMDTSQISETKPILIWVK